jgi:hypothetical protein
MLFHAQLDRDARSLYLVQFQVRIDGPVDADRLREAAATMLQRHASLRAAFRYRQSGEPAQIIRRMVPLDWTELSNRQMTISSKWAVALRDLSPRMRRWMCLPRWTRRCM